MKAITLHQPYASLVALKVKRIETRSWRAPASLIGQRIAIHAAARDDSGRCPHGCRRRRMEWHGDAWYCSTCGDEWTPRDDWWNDLDATREPLPLGAVVATAALTACVPMVDDADDDPNMIACLDVGGTDCALYYGEGDLGPAVDMRDQLPFGDFAPGRWAWLLDDIAPTTERCPACWGTGYDCERDGHPMGLRCICSMCDGEGSCEPIRAKGGQRVWNWQARA